MKNIFQSFLPFLIMFSFIFISCNKGTNRNILEIKKTSPGFARIVGTVIKIEPGLDTNKPNSPCGKVPCITVVKIDSILGYGSAFGKPLNLDTNIKLKFMFTTQETTKELFPNINEYYPGVKVGSQFFGNVKEIKSSINNYSNNNLRLYKLFGYKILMQ
ncbi:MAG: hypothetical protein IIB83_08000 [Bacteroidetes bacterium]|nr:hypothetical protein [Bacteroidota bacterium]